MDSLDDLDRALLDILSVDARQTGEQLAARIGLSPAACLRRIQRLRKIGAIQREVAILSPDVTGKRVTVVVRLNFARERLNEIDALKSRLIRLPEVERLFHVTGDADFVLILSCETMEDYAAFTEAHFYEPFLKGFESMVVLREYHKQLGGPD